MMFFRGILIIFSLYLSFANTVFAQDKFAFLGGYASLDNAKENDIDALRNFNLFLQSRHWKTLMAFGTPEIHEKIRTGDYFGHEYAKDLDAAIPLDVPLVPFGILKAIQNERKFINIPDLVNTPLFFYFSTHGKNNTDELGDIVNHRITIKEGESYPTEAITLSPFTLYDQLNGSAPTFVILDACYSGQALEDYLNDSELDHSQLCTIATSSAGKITFFSNLFSFGAFMAAMETNGLPFNADSGHVPTVFGHDVSTMRQLLILSLRYNTLDDAYRTPLYTLNFGLDALNVESPQQFAQATLDLIQKKSNFVYGQSFYKQLPEEIKQSIEQTRKEVEVFARKILKKDTPEDLTFIKEVYQKPYANGDYQGIVEQLDFMYKEFSRILRNDTIFENFQSILGSSPGYFPGFYTPEMVDKQFHMANDLSHDDQYKFSEEELNIFSTYFSNALIPLVQEFHYLNNAMQRGPYVAYAGNQHNKLRDYIMANLLYLATPNGKAPNPCLDFVF